MYRKGVRAANTIIVMSPDHSRAVGTIVYGEGEGFVHSHGMYAMHSHIKDHG